MTIVLLGNVVGGALFCGGYYYVMYSWRQPDVLVHHQLARDDIEQVIERKGTAAEVQHSANDSGPDRQRYLSE